MDTVSTHVVPLPVTAPEYTMSTLAVAKLKSAAVTPVTAWLKVAVNVSWLLATGLVRLDEKVAVGGLYLMGEAALHGNVRLVPCGAMSARIG